MANYEITLQFNHYPDMVNLIKTVRQKDTNRANRVNGFSGDVRVIVNDDILQELIKVKDKDVVPLLIGDGQSWRTEDVNQIVVEHDMEGDE
tara:strand:+ start:3637 stop:3909 length:273 start_codon:yes stop_codon:yes gene_type:complete